MMALEICLQLSTVSTARAAVNAALHRTGSFNVTTCKTVKKHNYSTMSLSFPSSYQTSRKSRIVCQAQEAVDIVQEVTDKNWESLVLTSGNPVLVEFWAPWCGPCKIIEPVIAQLAKEYAGKVTCLKLNTDASPTIATQYGIRSIPTVLFFKNGERKESIIGAVPKNTLSSALDKYIDN